jgi:hypothetical protein
MDIGPGDFVPADQEKPSVSREPSVRSTGECRVRCHALGGSRLAANMAGAASTIVALVRAVRLRTGDNSIVTTTVTDVTSRPHAGPTPAEP